MAEKQTINIDWSNIGFGYRKTELRFVSRYKDGKWDQGILTDNNQITVSEASPVFHYGQGIFEGLKAFRSKDGRILIFRPHENAKRFQASARRLLMKEVPTEIFIEGIRRVVKANIQYLPPYGSGASLYIRPFLIGIGDILGICPAPEYEFRIFVAPVGPYFKGDLQPVNFSITDYDRAAPQGTGAVKMGGNYAASMLPHQLAVEQGFTDCIYLDAKEKKYIEEVGAANFFGINQKKQFITPKSPSILPSITKKSLIYIAKNYLNMEVIEKPIAIDEIDQFVEAGACGTATVITPIGGICYQEKMHRFYKDGKEAGPVITKLYKILTEIQKGDQPAPENWIMEIN